MTLCYLEFPNIFKRQKYVIRIQIYKTHTFKIAIYNPKKDQNILKIIQKQM